ncbi:MAG: hypothetical protein MJ227_04665, partial [Bacilli bacterium]|nr:hypothetical protein [Bacilli bacterium]
VIKEVYSGFDSNVTQNKGTTLVTIPNHIIKEAKYLDCKSKVELTNNNHTIKVKSFDYGEARLVRVVRFK